MDASPFPYQGPLEPGRLQGRTALLEDLTERVTEHRVTALLGPRRFGKTSVLLRLAADLTEVTTVWVDLYEATSIADVAVRFDDALARPAGPFGRTARKLAATASVNLGVVKFELTGPARNRPDPDLTLRALLEVLVGSAQRVPTLLVVDEFSSIARVPAAAGALRTALQHHFTTLGVMFAGSQPSMMRTLFTDRAEPFYGQADLVEITALAAADVEEIVSGGFAETGRDAGPLAAHIHRFASGHPQRTMQLADACWRRTPSGGAATEDTWVSGLGDVRFATADGMERLYSRFERGERDVLRAVARSGSIFGAEAALLDLSVGAANHARGSLIDHGDLVRTDDGLSIVDPVLADWVRTRFPL